MRRKTVLTGAFAVTALGVVGLGVAIWNQIVPWARDGEETRDFLATMAMQTERIDRLQAARADSDAELARLHHKLDVLIANSGASGATSPGVPPGDSGVSPMAADEGVLAEMPLDAEEAHSVDWVDPLADAYDHEWSQSDWGKSAADAIDAAIPKHPFFSRYGGDFVTDCKMTTCRIEWWLPNTSQLSAGEREELLSMARYEMLALAAGNASEVGQLSTEWALEGPAPRIATIFKRADASE